MQPTFFRRARGRRWVPQGFYEFEFDGPRPPYDLERSTLWRKELLTAEEKVTLENEWKVEFQRAQASDFTLHDGNEVLTGDCARTEHYRHHDIPRELVRRWSAAARRRRSKATGKEADATSTPQPSSRLA